MTDHTTAPRPVPAAGTDVIGEQKHRQARGWNNGFDGKSAGVECACGETFGGFPTMTDARKILGYHIAAGNAKTTTAAGDTPPGQGFAAYLTAQERDQLDARSAEAERDEATEDRDLLRAENANLTAGLRTAQKQRDEALEVRDVLRHRLDAMTQAALDHRHTASEALAERDAARNDAKQAAQLADFRQGVIDRHRQELRAAGEVLAVVRDAVERIDRALATYDTTPVEEAEREDEATPERVAEDIAVAIETHFLPDNLTAIQAARIARHHATQYGPAPSSVPSRRAQEEPASDARRLLDQTIADALPLAGGRVRKLLKALRRELVRVDAKRAEQAEATP